MTDKDVIRTHDKDATASVSESESPAIPSPTPKRKRPRTNKDWWPDQLDLSVLHQHSALSNPVGDDFDYREAFKTLDVDALKRDLTELMDDVNRFARRQPALFVGAAFAAGALAARFLKSSPDGERRFRSSAAPGYAPAARHPGGL